MGDPAFRRSMHERVRAETAAFAALSGTWTTAFFQSANSPDGSGPHEAPLDAIARMRELLADWREVLEDAGVKTELADLAHVEAALESVEALVRRRIEAETARRGV